MNPMTWAVNACPDDIGALVDVGVATVPVVGAGVKDAGVDRVVCGGVAVVVAGAVPCALFKAVTRASRKILPRLCCVPADCVGGVKLVVVGVVRV